MKPIRKEWAEAPCPADRIRRLNEQPWTKGAYVLYWMQQAQRAEGNLALDFAVTEANARGVGILVLFVLDPRYPDATLRSYTFMIEGLRETQLELERRGIRFVMVAGDPAEVVLRASKQAVQVVCDRGYLAHQRRWRRHVATQAPCAVYEVEADAVVPLETASGKAEYAARTLRPKIRRVLDDPPAPGPPILPRHPPPRTPASLQSYPLRRFPSGLHIDTSVGPVTSEFPGGTAEARARLARFIAQDIRHYAARGKRPDAPAVSGLAPYLHFGQISPLEVMAEIRRTVPDNENRAAFLEQLCVRRELSHNFVAYTSNYDQYEYAVPDWAQKTLATHASDPRPYLYSRDALERAATHDPYWNAMMVCMRNTGYVHNHLRMYWGKKVLEWSASPEDAFETLLQLNNRWFLDGRDPNSYASVAWIFGRHDRPWANRPVFGTVRCMTAGGLERAFDVRAWSRKFLDVPFSDKLQL